MSFQRDSDLRGPPPNPLGFPPAFDPMFMPPGFPGIPGMFPPGMPPPHLVPPPSEYAPKPELVTPIFVGNISSRCSNEFLQRLLGECGIVYSWKRIQGSQGRQQAFGFCEFQQTEGTLRALRILSTFRLGDKQLVAKVEDKLHAELNEWAAKKRKEEGKETLELEEGELPVDEEDRKGDEETRQRILEWMKSDFPEIPVEVVLEEEKKKEKKKRDKEGKKEKKTRRDCSSSRHRRRDRSNSRRRRRSRSSHSLSGRSASRSPAKRRHSSSDSEPSKDGEEMKRELRIKERRYRDRERKWERREKERVRFYEDEKRAEKDKRIRTEREAQKLLRFMEDYNDIVQDAKFFKGDHWAKRMKEIARERVKDERDRLDEAAELEEYRKALEKTRVEEDSQEDTVSSKGAEEEEAAKKEEEMVKKEVEETVETTAETWTTAEIKKESPTTSSTVPVSKPPPTVLPGIVPKDSLQSRVHAVFGVKEDDDEMDHLRTRKRLKPFEITAEDRRQNMTEQERKHLTQRVIKEIPVEKEGLFAYAMDWTQVDKELVTGRVRPWVSKKITEYIGEREDALVDFICGKVSEHKGAEEILSDIYQILDDDAEMFVIKLWRLLIYETQAKKLGIAK